MEEEKITVEKVAEAFKEVEEKETEKVTITKIHATEVKEKKKEKPFSPRTIRRDELNKLFYIDQVIAVKGKRFSVRKVTDKDVTLRLIAQ